METRIVEVLLPNGATALVRATDLDGGGFGATKAGFADRFDFDDVVATLEAVSGAIRAGLAKAAPDKVTVELGIELTVKSGRLTGLVVEGGGTASLSITLEWEREKPGT